MERERTVLIVLFVVLAGSSLGLFRSTDTDLTIYLAGAMLGAAATGIAVQLRGGVDR
ncbi:hypothetical protein B4589_012585 [Halolamina sp. CBA1230]|uniref:hypothetical protein n=1 Tax=Halolamina sp. CBA1230 TaxID=1853690 RepID=UPI001301D144|nr:hypothetical protein [Halolamina sp. CBA1230]QKY21168.1 hypothetical protein B4589_012585 [Halolamina sp. CBA1230]